MNTISHMIFTLLLMFNFWKICW